MFRPLVPAISLCLVGTALGQTPDLAKSTLNPRGRTVATPVISEAQIRAAVREEIGSQLKVGLDRLVQSGVLKGDPGQPGAPGQGIDDVVVRNLPAGSQATREIITDPEDGARVLVLGIPLPKDGQTPTVDYATVVANLRNDAAFRTEVSKLVSSPTVDYDTLLARFKSDGSFVGPPGEPGAPGTPGEDGASGGLGTGAVSAIAGGTGVAGVGLGSLALALLRRRKEGDAGDTGDTFRERRRERVRNRTGAILPVDPEDGRQILRLARSEGRSPLLDAIIGRVALDRMDEIIDSSRTETKQREWARRLRQDILDDFNELAPLSTRERFG